MEFEEFVEIYLPWVQTHTVAEGRAQATCAEVADGKVPWCKVKVRLRVQRSCQRSAGRLWSALG